MNSFKNNFYVQTTYAYVKLVYIIFPFLLILSLIVKIFPLSLHSNGIMNALINVDLFALWTKEKPITEITLGLFVFIVNISIAAAIYYCLKRLKAFLKNVYEDKPFIKENGKHLKIIGILIMIFSTLFYVIKTILFHINALPISQTLAYISLVANLISSLLNPYLMIGLVVFVIGEVIVRAAELKEEQDLTV